LRATFESLYCNGNDFTPLAGNMQFHFGWHKKTVDRDEAGQPLRRRKDENY
jgi:hypothetical protein